MPLIFDAPYLNSIFLDVAGVDVEVSGVDVVVVVVVSLWL